MTTRRDLQDLFSSETSFEKQNSEAHKTSKSVPLITKLCGRRNRISETYIQHNEDVVSVIQQGSACYCCRSHVDRPRERSKP